MRGAVVQDEDWDKLEHSGLFSSVMSYAFCGFNIQKSASEEHLSDSHLKETQCIQKCFYSLYTIGTI